MPASSRSAILLVSARYRKGLFSAKNQEKVVVYKTVIKEIIIGLPQGLIDAPRGTLEVPNGYPRSCRGTRWNKKMFLMKFTGYALITDINTTTFSWFLVERKPFFYIQHSPLTAFLLDAGTLTEPGRESHTSCTRWKSKTVSFWLEHEV